MCPSGLRGVLWAALCLWSCGIASSQSASSEEILADLSRLNATCGLNLCSVDPYRKTTSMYDRHGCRCDEQCADFADCCVDAGVSGVARTDVSCVPMEGQRGMFMVDSCPQRWTRESVRRNCERDRDLSALADPFRALPVTDLAAGVTYKNIHCATCNDHMAHQTLWSGLFYCAGLSKDEREVSHRDISRGANGSWGVTRTRDGRTEFTQCQLRFIEPAGIDSVARWCTRSVRYCAETWQDVAVRRLCRSYTATVDDPQFVAYRNSHCALCNGVPLDHQTCPDRLLPRFVSSSPPKSFSLLLDFNELSGQVVGTVDVCSESQRWDPFFKRCREVFCDVEGYILVDDECIISENVSESVPSSESDAFTPETPDNSIKCPKQFLDVWEYEFSDKETVYVPIYKAHYAPGQYDIVDGKLSICAESSDFQKFDHFLAYVSMVLSVASVVCLVLHLLVFCLVPDLRNLSGISLACICVCLLCGYICFIASSFVQQQTNGCATLGVVMYGSYLASFLWMNVVAFDVFLSIRRATRELRMVSGRQTGRLLLYLLYVVACTTLAVTSALLVDLLPGVDRLYRPQFGLQVCWFTQRRALLVFFAVPLAAMMVANLGFFIASAIIIQRNTSDISRSACGPPRENLRVFSRLAVLMGLSWITGLLAGTLDLKPLWYVFTLLNTLQGVFIFVSFTLAAGVRRQLRSRLTSTGWRYRMSTGSSDDTAHTTSSGTGQRKASQSESYM